MAAAPVLNSSFFKSSCPLPPLLWSVNVLLLQSTNRPLGKNPLKLLGLPPYFPVSILSSIYISGDVVPLTCLWRTLCVFQSCPCLLLRDLHLYTSGSPSSFSSQLAPWLPTLYFVSSLQWNCSPQICWWLLQCFANLTPSSLASLTFLEHLPLSAFLNSP